jgi:ubiquinone/menaquinone biosynthesis C-methylase UbiE
VSHTAGLERVRHPVFARIYPRLSAAADRVGGDEHRDRLLAGLSGRVVEVGAGNGLNFVHYPSTVTEVVAVEPEAYLRDRAADTAKHASVRVTVADGTATRLPLPDESVDAGVVSLVLCSVPDQSAALTELRRVIKPGGSLRFYEHVLAADPFWARWQRRIEPIWARVGGGCRLTRDTEQAIRAAGFVVEENDRFLFKRCWAFRVAADHILGRARRI